MESVAWRLGGGRPRRDDAGVRTYSRKIRIPSLPVDGVPRRTIRGSPHDPVETDGVGN